MGAPRSATPSSPRPIAEVRLHLGDVGDPGGKEHPVNEEDGDDALDGGGPAWSALGAQAG